MGSFLYSKSMAHIHELYDFTVSAFILHPTKPQILLLKHLKLGKWLQPGGHVELHENPLQALTHELEEEAGLSANDYTIIELAEGPKTYGNNTSFPLPFYFNEHTFNETHKHIDICYLARAKTDEITTNPDGASAIKWLSLKEIEQHYTNGDVFDDTLQICKWVFAKFF